MKARIVFTVEVANEFLPQLYEFMQTTRESVRDSLTAEASDYLSEYLDSNGIPNAIIIDGHRSTSR